MGLVKIANDYRSKGVREFEIRGKTRSDGDQQLVWSEESG